MLTLDDQLVDQRGRRDRQMEQGTYTVKATSYWVITWAGIGQTGTIPIQVSNTATINIGEAQVLTQ